MENIVRTTAKRVGEMAKHVFLEEDSVNKFCTDFQMSHVMHWLEDAPFNITELSDDARLAFLFVFNSISFSYWGTPKWTIQYRDKFFDGAWAMIACLAKAYQAGIPILDPNYIVNLSEKDFSEILAGNVEIPLIKERVNFLHQLGAIVVDRFDGSYLNIILQAEGDAYALLQLLIQNFPFFEDKSEYRGLPVYFYKRAQLLVADIFQGFNEKGYGALENIEMLTACADYKLPQVLRKFGIISYSKELAHKIDNRIELDKGGNEEIEIRSQTICAVEKIQERLVTSIPDIKSIHINDRLWLLGQIKTPNDKPYHLVRTTNY
jgi:hypothetical protein